MEGGEYNKSPPFFAKFAYYMERHTTCTVFIKWHAFFELLHEIKVGKEGKACNFTFYILFRNIGKPLHLHLMFLLQEQPSLPSHMTWQEGMTP
jgi:hypothetical protein